MEIFLVTMFIVFMLSFATNVSIFILRAIFDLGNEEIYLGIGLISIIFAFTCGIIGALLYGK